MRVEPYRDGFKLVASRRNLLTLLAKLDGHPSDSLCTIEAPPIYGTIALSAEEDDVHYSHPSRLGTAAGVMHPDTEEALA